jgi:hypothetical protein
LGSQASKEKKNGLIISTSEGGFLSFQGQILFSFFVNIVTSFNAGLGI